MASESNILPTTLGQRSVWDGTRTLIGEALTTASGNLSLRIGRTLSVEQGDLLPEEAAALNAAEDVYEQVAFLTLSPEDARVLRDTLTTFLGEGLDSRWQATVAWLQEDAGLDASGTETLIRLAASTADESADDLRNPYQQALRSFSEPQEVHERAMGGRQETLPGGLTSLATCC
jgi:hypothetical protein